MLCCFWKVIFDNWREKDSSLFMSIWKVSVAILKFYQRTIFHLWKKTVWIASHLIRQRRVVLERCITWKATVFWKNQVIWSKNEGFCCFCQICGWTIWTRENVMNHRGVYQMINFRIFAVLWYNDFSTENTNSRLQGGSQHAMWCGQDYLDAKLVFPRVWTDAIIPPPWNWEWIETGTVEAKKNWLHGERWSNKD